jgi:L-ribulose-5-phosphate 4-epimerase
LAPRYFRLVWRLQAETRVSQLLDDARNDVLEGARRMSRLGLVVASWGNVSARAGASDLAVVTPSGVAYECLTPEMLDVVSVASGRVVQGRLRPTSELEMHLAILRAREDVAGIVHTHSAYASAFAVARQDIPPILEDLAQAVGGPVVCARYAPAGSRELAAHVVEALGARNAALLANHGVVGVGHSVTEALRVCEVVEKAAGVYAIARGIGTPSTLPPEDVRRLHAEYVASYGQPVGRS